MKTLKQEILQASKIIILALFIAVGTGYIFADWSAPTSTPPTCVAGTPGCDAPLNVGYGGQVKQGNLDIKGLINSTTSAVNGLIVENGNVGIGTIAPAQKLDVTGQIHATGDICTDAGGGKCLGSAGIVATGPSYTICSDAATYHSNPSLLGGNMPPCTRWSSSGFQGWFSCDAGYHASSIHESFNGNSYFVDAVTCSAASGSGSIDPWATFKATYGISNFPNQIICGNPTAPTAALMVSITQVYNDGGVRVVQYSYPGTAAVVREYKLSDGTIYASSGPNVNCSTSLSLDGRLVQM